MGLRSCIGDTGTMGSVDARTPLLRVGVQVEAEQEHVNVKGGVASGLVKWVLKIVMWAIFISWVSLIFLYPAESVNALVDRWNRALSGSIFGITGSVFLVFSAPILLIAFLAIVRLLISGEDEHELLPEGKKSPSFRLWTFPVLVDGPFGVVSAAELIVIILFAAYVLWAVYAYTLRNISILSQFQLTIKEERLFMVELLGLRLGMIGLFCLAFLFLPVARGSVLLRLIDIPFEHATRYHVWLGHLTMLLFTLHGLLFVIPWAIQGTLLKEILDWKDVGIANLAGVISLIAGLFMWLTSLPLVRKLYFELFFYTHQLYVVFVIFLALHVGDFIFSIAAGPIFLFMLDRFLRFCQSRRTVDIISASCLPCGTVELVLSKPASLRYNALSFIFLQIRELSFLQWHPFSVSSSPMEGKHHISVLIKVLGEWTSKLRGNISHISETEPQKEMPFRLPDKITASVEGPYGHESPYHLGYEHLILVAGGIGISPFLAILSDIMHRIRDGKPCLTRNVLVVWAVKGSNEIPLLSVIDTESVCPFLSDKLNLEVQIYVTRESEPPLEEGKVHKEALSCSSVYPAGGGCGSGMSVLVGTGNNVWSGMYVISSTIGLIVMMGLVDKFYIIPKGISAWWYKGLLFIACMAGSILIFGGLVISLWHLWEKKVAAAREVDEKPVQVEPVTNQDSYGDGASLVSSAITRYGSRPDFNEIFGCVSDKWGRVDVGMIVCGPSTLETSVAKECRSMNLRRQSHRPVFHFNSHSFDL